ncbi:MAG: hypothetical protein M3040_00850 [Bacteroidota bacterium]|nr:hypothetical protein [Bacteroidota bacterium]
MENNFKDLENANKEIEKSKVIFNDTERSVSKKDKDPEEEDENIADEKVKKGSGIFTADGEELPEIEGGYDIVDPGGTLGDDDFVS